MLVISSVLNYNGETATSTVEKIKSGDKHLKEKFIEDYIPFIIRVITGIYASKAVDVKNSDEYSVGLMAFDEAIEKFDGSKSNQFLKFAQLVIKRRVVDYLRHISPISKNEIPFSYFNSRSDSELEEKLNLYDFGLEAGRYELICELKDFSRQLETFGLSIGKLPDYIPKHRDSKQICINIAKKIIENKHIYKKLLTKKYFMMKELSKIIDVHPKTVERNREFIICVCIVYENDYENFKAYLGMLK
ncbi:MAG TPA: RNA polymerase sigma factor SigI [Pseudobacteroides sp.]|uniref:RNA polymerase sigma factor SigI n=1 Tax=Pseudobacteroides sp. TaxID=1968840 RepID=UPI002F932D77